MRDPIKNLKNDKSFSVFETFEAEFLRQTSKLF